MVTASIVVHNTPKDQLKKVLECLKNSSVDKIYVIDNSQTDVLKSLCSNIDQVYYLKVDNHGYGAGHNIAIKKSIKEKADYHLVLNADIWWRGDIINPLIKYLQKNPDIGLVSPKTFYPNGKLQSTCRMLPTPVDLFFKRFLPGVIKKKRIERYLLQNHDSNKELNCPYLLGSFMFFRVKTLEEVGLFDERFFMYPEDIDITRRIHEKWKTMYWPGVTIIHEHQQASQKNFKMFLIHFYNMIKYFNKWGWFYDPKRRVYNKKLGN